MKKFLLCLILLPTFAFGNNDSLQTRKWITTVGTAAFYGTFFTSLNSAWYANYPRSTFHFFNDNGEWLQMDKVGHANTCYQVGRAGIEAMKWAGFTKNQSIWIGCYAGTFMLTGVEILDGFSKEWGFSWGDCIANIAGGTIAGLEHSKWGGQRIHFKWNYQPTVYSSIRPNILGNNWLERALKDYNGQTYWLSFSPNLFTNRPIAPEWLNISLGYGATGMLGGFDNKWTNAAGQSFDYSSTVRARQWYCSLDIDLTKIPTKKRWLKQTFYVLNYFKIPLPTIGYDKVNGFKFHPLF